MEETLKECPFCGGYAEYESLYANYQHIYCKKCGATSTIIQATVEKSLPTVRQELKTLWNKRAN